MDDVVALRVWFWLVLCEEVENYYNEIVDYKIKKCGHIPIHRREREEQPRTGDPVASFTGIGWSIWQGKMIRFYPIPFQRAVQRAIDTFCPNDYKVRTDWVLGIPETCDGLYTEDIAKIYSMLAENGFKFRKRVNE